MLKIIIIISVSLMMLFLQNQIKNESHHISFIINENGGGEIEIYLKSILNREIENNV